MPTDAAAAAVDTDLDLAAYALRLGDDALVLAQRLCAWVTRAPTVEEDLALSNIALDLLGQARTLYTLAGRLDGTGRDEDALAYGRPPAEFADTLLVEQANGDFARTLARQLHFAQYQQLLHTELRASAHPELAAFAARAAHESAWHLAHAARWCTTLGRGTEESRRRMQAGLAAQAPYTAELFEDDPLTARLAAAGTAPAPSALRQPWTAAVRAVLDQAGLELPETAPGQQLSGGRCGEHSPALAPLLDELREVRDAFPGGRW